MVNQIRLSNIAMNALLFEILLKVALKHQKINQHLKYDV
jgi:hypothetical protein